jgi:predicted RNA-binding Zn-ribbon protein involved in translation (DUF1610 family)
MRIPGFSAEASCYTSKNVYSSTKTVSVTVGGVYPQLRGWCANRCQACNLHGHWYDCLACGVLC